ncbi:MULTISPECIES: hypothetical protein [unclassified Streptomyces]|uniref:hypothetical protein n=1 Tax=unclassified Streptomyces TaxID=2593676 RepID=UPI002E34B2AB|nr:MULTISPECIES: hypothetical protein [unclassified Streptomyces]WUC62753.1 hypothetical protein OG861_00075 [Streptomyces sp. NBC_00539]
MIKNLMRRGLPALALAVLPLLSTAPASHAAGFPAAAAGGAFAPGAPGVSGAAGVRAPLSLFEAIDRLPVAEEHREGYKRDL